MEIIYKDESIIVVNKKPGVAVQPDKTSDLSLIEQLQTETKQDIHLVHRLDRPASGLLVFACNKLILNDLNQQFRERSVRKIYYAVVGIPPKSERGQLVHYIRKDAFQNRSFAFDKALHHTHQAELNYKIIGSIDRYHLLEIELITGRHHQIRAQLAAIGSPIKGDVKYGFRRGNRNRSIHLHARQLSFLHPTKQEEVTFTAALPEDNVWAAFNI